MPVLEDKPIYTRSKIRDKFVKKIGAIVDAQLTYEEQEDLKDLFKNTRREKWFKK